MGKGVLKKWINSSQKERKKSTTEKKGHNMHRGANSCKQINNCKVEQNNTRRKD